MGTPEKIMPTDMFGNPLYEGPWTRRQWDHVFGLAMKHLDEIKSDLSDDEWLKLLRIGQIYARNPAGFLDAVANLAYKSKKRGKE